MKLKALLLLALIGTVPVYSYQAHTAPTTVVNTQGVNLLDDFGRNINAHGITLVDWEGEVANPAIQIYVVPVRPGLVTITATEPRIYFNNPSIVSGTGPVKQLTFTDNKPKTFTVSIFPDKSGVDQDYTLTITTNSGNTITTQYVNVHVISQDQPFRTLDYPITVDFSQDQSGFFNDPVKRAITVQSAQDWMYFFDGTGLDTVPVGTETTSIWDMNAYTTSHKVTNSVAYKGYLLYAYGVVNNTETSGGEGAYAGRPQTVNGQQLPQRRSGGYEAYINGNYNLLGWSLDTNAEDWWEATNLGNTINDLMSISHHEIGHAICFSTANTTWNKYQTQGYVDDPRVVMYQGNNPTVDGHSHLAGNVDRQSGKGAFGNEYNGIMPNCRWIMTKLDLLVAQACGYKLRDTSAFKYLQLTTISIPNASTNVVYSTTLVATGGIPFYNWTITQGTLPTGLSIDPFSGIISGTPTIPGTYTFTVQVEEYDSNTLPVHQTYTINVNGTAKALSRRQLR